MVICKDDTLLLLRKQNELLLQRLHRGQSELRRLQPKKPGSPPNHGVSALARQKLTAANDAAADKPRSVVLEDAAAVGYYRAPTMTLQQTPKKSATALLSTTPTKSILKHRKIIDDNVKVHSKYEHTPCVQLKKTPSYSKDNSSSDRDRSFLEDTPSASLQMNGSMSKVVQGVNKCIPTTSADEQRTTEIREDCGNVRPRKQPSTTFTSITAKTLRGEREPLNQNPPLLGYDWIAGNLDNDRKLTAICNQPENFFEQLKHFRTMNRDECVVNPILNKPVDLSRPISPVIKDPTHTCIHGYSVNERLFTEPMNTDEDGKSICPICLATQRKPTRQSPTFVRVSIPRAGLQSPLELKPHRRRSFDPTDSCALSEHCLAGWECSQPATIKPAANIDLKHATDGIKSKLITTMDKAQMEAAGICF